MRRPAECQSLQSTTLRVAKRLQVWSRRDGAADRATDAALGKFFTSEAGDAIREERVPEWHGS